MATGTRSILLVDDEPRILRFLSRGLAAEGFGVHAAADGAEGLRLALADPYDLVILDLLMPGTGGAAVLRALLARKPVQPVLVLSCLADAETKAACLDLGAADYLAKPFSFDELLARVRARLRDRQRIADGTVRAAPMTLAARGLTLDLLRREADAGRGPVLLAEREFLLLRQLLEHPGQAVSKQRLLSAVWGYHFDPGSNVVDVCVSRLRAKLGRDSIRTIRGAGYAIDAQ